MDITTAIRKGELQIAARLIALRFGLPLESPWPEFWVETMQEVIKRNNTKTDGYFLSWIKCQIIDKSMLEEPGGQSYHYPQYKWRCHVGFLSVDETACMLYRLRKEAAFQKQHDTPLPVTSKIFNTNHVPQPVDRVAARVAQLFNRKINEGAS